MKKSQTKAREDMGLVAKCPTAPEYVHFLAVRLVHGDFEAKYVVVGLGMGEKGEEERG